MCHASAEPAHPPTTEATERRFHFRVFRGFSISLERSKTLSLAPGLAELINDRL